MTDQNDSMPLCPGCGNLDSDHGPDDFDSDGLCLRYMATPRQQAQEINAALVRAARDAYESAKYRRAPLVERRRLRRILEAAERAANARPSRRI